MYHADLARLHHHHFGQVAAAAAEFLVEHLRAAGQEEGVVVELACGSGISSRVLSAAGYRVVGFDISPDMLAIARANVPGGRFERGSLWEVALPPCVAVTAVGEAFCYATADRAPSAAELCRRFTDIATALVRGGAFLFDVAAPGRSGPAGERWASWDYDEGFLWLHEREDAGALTRTIDSFVAHGQLYRHSRETHRLTRYAPETVESALAGAGLTARRVDYGDLRARPGWHAYLGERE